jgi:uncharacterized protein (DUF2147 family)
MRKLLVTAAFLLVSTAAHAQYTFEYGGRTIRIDPDRGTVSIPGVYDNTGQAKTRKARKTEPKQDQHAPQQAKVDPQPPAAPAPAVPAAPPAAEQSPAPAAATPPAAPPAPPATVTVNNAPADTFMVPPPQPPASAPAGKQAAAPPAPPAPPPPAPAAAPPAAPVQTAVATPAPAAAAAYDPNSPLGVWLTEEKEGKVRIEPCGTNLCGYSVDAKSDQNGEQVLINMKPTKDQKWTGRIFDPNSGSTYDSTIALKGSDHLRVQGCAFGGMFCGGQTWTRVN